MKLYGIPPTRALRPIWLLNELDLDCEIISVNLPEGEHLAPAFLAINPLGKVPVLVDGDIVLAESAAISLYLAERYGRGRLIPGDFNERTMMHQWLYFLVTEIEQPLWRIALHSFIYPEGERLPTEIEVAKRDCRRMLAPLDRHMENREFFVGSAPTVADFIAAYTLDWATEEALLEGFPNLSRFVERMYARPAAPHTIKEAFASLQAGSSARRWRAGIRPQRRQNHDAESPETGAAADRVAREEIAGLCRTLQQAHAKKDADAILSWYAKDAVIYDLAPPLGRRGLNRENLAAWLATWDGPILIDGTETDLVIDGGVGWMTALNRMRGRKTDGEQVDLWFRTTMCFAKQGRSWKIVHDHSSVPFHMDGSYRAALQLTPDAAPWNDASTNAEKAADQTKTF